jgi:hypothetical protein
MWDRKILLEDVIENGKHFRGRSEYIKFLEGKPLSRAEAMTAECYECMGYYTDAGAEDCESQSCPLHAYMPYAKIKRETGRVAHPKAIEALAKARARKKELAASE